MHQATLLVILALFVAQCYGSGQVQMPEAAELQDPGDEDLNAQVKELQKNVTVIWNYIYQLRSAVSHHLTHLRQHQVDLETAMHRMEHFHESDLQSANMHHHSGEQHSHSGEHHSHGNEHSHGTDHSHGTIDGHSHSDEHSHGTDHSHGTMEGHSHSGEHHSHSDEHHHSNEHGHHSHSYSHSSHDHSKEDSHSHSHSSHDHSKEDSHSHGGHDDHHDHDHKDSHETEDLQQTQKIDPVAEPIVTATTRQEHYHHHHHHQSFNSDSMNLLNEHSHDHHHHHDHSHDSTSSVKNRTVVLPKYSEYGTYDLALCRVQPNSALPEDQKQNIFGTITMWQKKSGGPLNFHVRLQGFNVGDHHAHHQQTIETQLDQQDNETPQPVAHTHGFHIHASGDLSNGCQSTGPHYNPKGVNHGKPEPDALSRHVGDLGNIQCDEHGITNIVFSDDVASLTGQYSVIGKSIVIHAQEDDLGLGGDAESLKTGNAGPRLACCEIQSVDKIPIRQYKSMKTASQRNN